MSGPSARADVIDHRERDACPAMKISLANYTRVSYIPTIETRLRVEMKTARSGVAAPDRT